MVSCAQQHAINVLPVLDLLLQANQVLVSPVQVNLLQDHQGQPIMTAALVQIPVVWSHCREGTKLSVVPGSWLKATDVKAMATYVPICVTGVPQPPVNQVQASLPPVNQVQVSLLPVNQVLVSLLQANQVLVSLLQANQVLVSLLPVNQVLVNLLQASLLVEVLAKTILHRLSSNSILVSSAHVDG